MISVFFCASTVVCPSAAAVTSQKAAVSLEPEVSVTLLKEVEVYSETEDAAKINPLARREAADFLQVLLAVSGVNVVSTYTVLD